LSLVYLLKSSSADPELPLKIILTLRFEVLLLIEERRESFAFFFVS
jgi:hypothetical protein